MKVSDAALSVLKEEVAERDGVSKAPEASLPTPLPPVQSEKLGQMELASVGAPDRTGTSESMAYDAKVEVRDGRNKTALVGVKSIKGCHIVEHMNVIASDGEVIGTVDHLEGPDLIRVVEPPSHGGHHHIVPMTWVRHIDKSVHLNRNASELKGDW